MGTNGVETVENLKELLDKHAFDLTQQLDVNTRFLTYLTKSHLLSPSELLQFQKYDSQADRVKTILKILPTRDKPNANLAFIESLRQSGQDDLAMLLMGGKSEVDLISHYQSALQLQFHEIKRHLKMEISELERVLDPENVEETKSSLRVLQTVHNNTESTIKQLENCEQILDRLHEDCLKIAKANIDMLQKIETVDSTIRSVLEVGRKSYFPQKKSFSDSSKSTQPNSIIDPSVNRSLALRSNYNHNGQKLQGAPVTRRSVAKVSTGGEYIKTSDFRTCVQITERLLKEIKEGLKSDNVPEYGTRMVAAGKSTSYKYQSRARPTRSIPTSGATNISNRVSLKNILLDRLMEIDTKFHSYVNRLKPSSKGQGLSVKKPFATSYRSQLVNETVASNKKASKGVQTDKSAYTAQEERKLAERASQIAKSLDKQNNEDLMKIVDNMHKTITERIVTLTTSNPKMMSRRPRPGSAGQGELTHRLSEDLLKPTIDHTSKFRNEYRTASNQRTIVRLRDLNRELKAYTELELQLSESILNEKKKTAQKEEIIKIRDNELKSYRQIVTAIESERDTFKRLYERANKSIPLKPIRVDPKRHGASMREHVPNNASDEHDKPEAEQELPVLTVDV